MQIEDRVFIVTGASSGIGLSTAIALSDRGAKVALLARTTDALHAQARYFANDRLRKMAGVTAWKIVMLPATRDRMRTAII
jgi:NADP-dependent 3-hydroxy acid dehydrogenase YdfG